VWLLLAAAGAAAGAPDDAFARVCRAKLRVLYEATMQFAADHDGYLPPAWMAPEVKAPIPGRGAWHECLKPYLARMGERTDCGYRPNRRQPASTVAHCPANPYWYGGNGPNCIGYAWNSNLGLIALRDGKRSGTGPFRFAEVSNKARTVLLVDAAMAPKRPPYCVYHAAHPRQAGAWHDGKVQVLFLDGHVEAHPPDALDPSWFAVKIRGGQ